MCASSSCQICSGMHLCSEVEEQEEEVSGWQEDVQLSIEQGQDGLEANGDVYLRHEPDATRRRPLWIAGIQEGLEVQLEKRKSDRKQPLPEDRLVWKIKSDGWLVGFGKAVTLPSGIEEDLSSYDENGPRLKVQGKGSLEVNSQYRDMVVITSCLTSQHPPLLSTK
jgi:hypothetical protein